MKKSGIVLAMFALISTGLVSVTYHLTRGQIQNQAKKRLLSTLTEVMPKWMFDNEIYKSCTLVRLPYTEESTWVHAYIAKKGGIHSGLVIEAVAPDGYNGEMRLIVGVDNEGTILGTRVLLQQETPGLGDRIDLRVSDWILGFTGKSLPPENSSSWYVKKDGGRIAQFTGATITPRAVVKALRRTLRFVSEQRGNIYTQSYNCSERGNL